MANRLVQVSTEPLASKISFERDDYNSALINSMNWYTTEKDRKTAKKYLNDYMVKAGNFDHARMTSVLDSDIIPTYGWVARIAIKGGKLSSKHIGGLNEYLEELLKKYAPKPQVSVQPRVSIQESIQNKVTSYLGELDAVVDSLVTGEVSEFNLLADLKARHLPQQCGPAIEEWTKGQLREFIEVYQTKDAQVKEGYSNIDRKVLKNLIKVLGSFIEAVEKYYYFKKANRKPREKKARPPSVQVKGLKYKNKDDELGIESVSATEIVGAMQVWCFNTKTRKLTLYKTDSASGIQVKGTSLQNYDPDMSLQKTLRKPAEQLQQLLSAGKIQLRKYMDTIKAAAQKPSGRINADTLIVKAVK